MLYPSFFGLIIATIMLFPAITFAQLATTQTVVVEDDETQCDPPRWDGFRVDACFDNNGKAECVGKKMQEAANWWCQKSCGKSFAKRFSTTWKQDVGTRYAPTGRTCPTCSNHFVSIVCGGASAAPVTAPRTSCKATVPSDAWKGEYYANPELKGPPLMVRNDGKGAIDFEWSVASPQASCGVPADGFSARWTRVVPFEGGTYIFTAITDDGMRFYFDDNILLDSWRDQGESGYDMKQKVTAGEHTLKIVYYERKGGATAKLSWRKIDDDPKDSVKQALHTAFLNEEGTLPALRVLFNNDKSQPFQEGLRYLTAHPQGGSAGLAQWLKENKMRFAEQTGIAALVKKSAPVAIRKDADDLDDYLADFFGVKRPESTKERKAREAKEKQAAQEKAMKELQEKAAKEKAMQEAKKKEVKKAAPPPVLDEEEEISDEELERLLKEEEESGAVDDEEAFEEVEEAFEEDDTSVAPAKQGLSSFFRRLVPFRWFAPGKSSPTDTAAAASKK